MTKKKSSQEQDGTHVITSEHEPNFCRPPFFNEVGITGMNVSVHIVSCQPSENTAHLVDKAKHLYRFLLECEKQLSDK